MNVLSDLISAGTKFQRGAPNTAKEPSYRDWFLCEHTLTSAYIFSQILLHDSYIFSQISLKKKKKKVFSVQECRIRVSLFLLVSLISMQPLAKNLIPQCRCDCASRDKIL